MDCNKNSKGGSHHSANDFRHHKELVSPSKLVTGDSSQNLADNVDLLGSISNIIEFNLFLEYVKPVEKPKYEEK